MSAVIDVRSLYNSTCAKCHAADGSGNTKMGEKFRADGKKMPALGGSTAEALRKIRDGVAGTPMKAYASRFTPAELDALARFVRTL